jgi:UDP-2,3-diacylglucosamine pyrophosphatase LpxH
MGLITGPYAPFPHEPWESDELLAALRRHKVFARHGDRFDPFNYEGDRNCSSLGDAIVVELLSRFSRQVELELADDLPVAALAGLREIDNIRPLLLIPVWIDGLLERTCPHAPTRKQVKLVWDRLADEFLDHPFVRRRDSWCPLDMVDGLQQALKFSRGVSVGWAARVAQWVFQLRGAASASYCNHALAEQDFRNRRARHIVYGHTHQAEALPLDASYTEGYVLNQLYFNSGTWRRVYQQTQLVPSEHEFIAADTMTYLAFFAGDERRGRPFETWSGTLGLAPTAGRHRLDGGAAADAAAESISAPTVPLAGPHFSLSPAPAAAGDRRTVRAGAGAAAGPV